MNNKLFFFGFLILTIVLVPLAVQIVYSLSAIEPMISADAVIQFVGVILGIAFGFWTSCLNRRAERTAQREADIRNQCLKLLYDLSSHPKSLQLSNETRDRIILLSVQLKALKTKTGNRIHKVMEPLAQRILDDKTAYDREIEQAFIESYDSCPIVSPEGDEGEVFRYENPDEEYSAREEKLKQTYQIPASELVEQIDKLIDELASVD